MSKENVGAFFSQLKEDVELQKKLQKLNGSRIDDALAQGVKIASEAGFPCTAAELKDGLADLDAGFRVVVKGADDELSDEELKQVAGGYLCMGLECEDGFEGTYLCETICCIEVGGD